MTAVNAPMARRLIAVRGVVQGVGFRPFIHALARALSLGGFVQNRRGEVRIEAEGTTTALDQLVSAIRARAPRLARVDDLAVTEMGIVGEASFRIAASEDEGSGSTIAADSAPCEACLAELADPEARRFGYAFLNCTDCGPRLTIATGAPYDRERTTMAAFPLCDACAGEQRDERDRRFHAQPIACPACGPRLELRGFEREPGEDPLAAAARALSSGRIVAVKSVGGYHLACDATDEAAVARLRARKHREAKPFAVLVSDLAGARALARVDETEARVLTSPARPIVLLASRDGSALAPSVAPGLALVGVLLPPSPLHARLARAVSRPLVMTSGNRAEEPIAIDDADARARLGEIADAFLSHDRSIAVRCDDSVTRVVGGAPVLLRRSRGFAPQSIELAIPLLRPTLAVGGELKAAFAMGVGRVAVLGPHTGDLGGLEALRAFDDTITHFEMLLGFAPEIVVHDLHPDYASTRWAEERAQRAGAELFAVQHHHAHFASCLADAGHLGPAIGVCFDGAGFGRDGATWGGEFLLGDARAVKRVGHLAYVPQPGGDAAAREPWRMAAAHLVAAGLDARAILGSRIEASALRAIVQLAEGSAHAPPTSSVGRLFDAVASIAGLGDRARYEAELAMRLEAAAASRRPGVDGLYAFSIKGEATNFTVSAAPVIRAVAADACKGEPVARIARRFHDGLAEAIAVACDRVGAEVGIGDVALSGGVFANAVLVEAATRALASRGFSVHRHRAVPPNDGGLALGQLAVTAARAAAGTEH